MNGLNELTQFFVDSKAIAQRWFFIRFADAQRTPLNGEAGEDKEDKLDYINATETTLTQPILAVFSDIAVNENSLSVVDDIFLEGVVIRYVLNADHPPQPLSAPSMRAYPESDSVFIPFRSQKGNPYERLYLLAAEAQVKLGTFDGIISLLMPSDDDKQTFTVINTRYITQNMLRIIFKSERALPTDNPGYAYRFKLTRNASQQRPIVANFFISVKQFWPLIEPRITHFPFVATIRHQLKKRALLLILAVYKRLPNNERKSAQPVGVVQRRYYTLRQLSSNHDGYTGEIDIYIHDDTQGSQWAKSLRAGDKIEVDNHYQETIKDMAIGQPLFICDETSMPSVAAVLEQWRHPVAPIVIHLTNDQAEAAYFNELILPSALQHKLHIDHIMTSDVDDIAQAVINTIDKHCKAIDCAWGALGKAHYRSI